MTKWPLVNVSKDTTSWVALDKIFTDYELDQLVMQANQIKKVSSTVGHGAVSNYRICDIAWLESDEVESDFIELDQGLKNVTEWMKYINQFK